MSFDKQALADVLVEYKMDFVEKVWPDEKYKWEAVKWFQDHWDINAENFSQMLAAALGKTYNLLDSMSAFPRGTILKFAEKYPDDVRAMFAMLFNEELGLFERIDAFKNKAKEIARKYYDDPKKSHYQTESALSVYLWLRYPDKYYIYKFSIMKNSAEFLKANYTFKSGDYENNINRFMAFYDEICEELQQDAELRNLLDENLTEACYPDLELRTLTIDVGHYISVIVDLKGKVQTENLVENDANSVTGFSGYNPTFKVLGKEDAEGWWPIDYNSGLSTSDWLKLLDNRTVFTSDSLKIMKRMLDCGGVATCKQLSDKYGLNINFYNSGSAYLAKRVAFCYELDEVFKDDRGSWWPILYLGKKAAKEDKGSFLWKLRPQLEAALKQYDMSKVPLYEEVPGQHNYWLLNASPKYWSMSDMEVGEVQDYTLYNENGNKRRIFKYFFEAKKGDKVIGYESHPTKKVVALMEVSDSQDGECIYFRKLADVKNKVPFKTFKKTPALSNMEYDGHNMGSLFKLTEEEYNCLYKLAMAEAVLPSYTAADFLSEVFMTASQYDRLSSVLSHKQNIILQGAPGVGKTFIAKRLAYAQMGVVDDSRIAFVQFHQNYSYEDFVMGYRPKEDADGYKLVEGVFYEFCNRARDDSDRPYYFIIDEINRGNLSKIFGELLMLIERDYRGKAITLAYKRGEEFSVPKNVYIIGMMNTADRSLAMIDYALRRRFSFFDIEPGFDSEGFVAYAKGINNACFDRLVAQVKLLNEEIAEDSSLGKGFCIGHSYFCLDEDSEILAGDDKTKEAKVNAWLQEVVDYDLLPMLQEYWFDEQKKVDSWTDKLQKALKDTENA